MDKLMPEDERVGASRAQETNELFQATPEIEREARLGANTRHPQNRTGLIVVVVVVALALIAAAYFLLWHKKKAAAPGSEGSGGAETSGSDEAVLTPEQRAVVATQEARMRTIQARVTTPGKVAFNGNRVTPVFSQFTGRLVRLAAEVGDRVSAGQVIGTIDTPDIVGAQSDYQQALSAERSARTSLDLATRTRERAERLAAAEAIPARDMEQAKADESRAGDDLRRSQSAAAAAQGKLQSLGMSGADIELAAGGARVNRLAPLTAPISGTIIERKAGIGEVVQAAQGDPLFMIADLSSVWVNADVYEDQLANIRTGTPVSIETPAYPTETFAARVDQIGSTLDPDKHTVAVRCVVSNRGGKLKPGMFASVVLNSAAAQSVITVPASAVVTEGDDREIYVETSPGQYAKRKVELGDSQGSDVIVKSGLSEGEKVVTRGGLLINANGPEG